MATVARASTPTRAGSVLLTLATRRGTHRLRRQHHLLDPGARDEVAHVDVIFCPALNGPAAASVTTGPPAEPFSSDRVPRLATRCAIPPVACRADHLDAIGQGRVGGDFPPGSLPIRRLLGRIAVVQCRLPAPSRVPGRRSRRVRHALVRNEIRSKGPDFESARGHGALRLVATHCG